MQAIMSLYGRIPGRIGRGLCATFLAFAAPALGWAESQDAVTGSYMPVAAFSSAGGSGLEELSDDELQGFRGRYLECRTGATQRKRVILWDEHRTVEMLEPMGSADPRNQIETSGGPVVPAHMLLP